LAIVFQISFGIVAVLLYIADCLSHLLQIGHLDFAGIGAACLCLGAVLQINDKSELCMHGKMNLPSCGKEYFLQPVSRFFFVR